MTEGADFLYERITECLETALDLVASADRDAQVERLHALCRDAAGLSRELANILRA